MHEHDGDVVLVTHIVPPQPLGPDQREPHGVGGTRWRISGPLGMHHRLKGNVRRALDRISEGGHGTHQHPIFVVCVFGALIVDVLIPELVH